MLYYIINKDINKMVNDFSLDLILNKLHFIILFFIKESFAFGVFS